MIVKVGDSLGETFGNFVGRLPATPAVLTPVIPAFRASFLVVHPVLPERGHAAMLTMVAAAVPAGTGVTLPRPVVGNSPLQSYSIDPGFAAVAVSQVFGERTAERTSWPMARGALDGSP